MTRINHPIVDQFSRDLFEDVGGQGLFGMRNLSRSDRALLASAWREVSGTPVSRDRKSCGSFKARYAGFCTRCGRSIEVGQIIQCDSDFDGAVHTGCHAPEISVRTTKAATASPRGASAVAAWQPPLCPDCNLEHAGDCW